MCDFVSTSASIWKLYSYYKCCEVILFYNDKKHHLFFLWVQSKSIISAFSAFPLNVISKHILNHKCLPLLSLFVWSLQFEGASGTYDNVLKYLNIVFTIFFFMESVLKIIAFGPLVRTAHMKHSSHSEEHKQTNKPHLGEEPSIP